MLKGNDVISFTFINDDVIKPSYLPFMSISGLKDGMSFFVFELFLLKNLYIFFKNSMRIVKFLVDLKETSLRNII